MQEIESAEMSTPTLAAWLLGFVVVVGFILTVFVTGIASSIDGPGSLGGLVPWFFDDARWIPIVLGFAMLGTSLWMAGVCAREMWERLCRK